MNKEEIVEMLDNYVQGINEKFMVKEDGADLCVYVNGNPFAGFANFDKTLFQIWPSNGQGILIAQTGIIQKFYMKACELLENLGEKKYTIQVIKNNEGSFLNLERERGKYTFWTKFNIPSYQFQFTKKEIEKLKQRQDVAIDWDKAIIKEVKNDE